MIEHININNILPYIIEKYIPGFEVESIEGYNDLEEILGVNSQTINIAFVNLSSYPTNTTYLDDEAFLNIAYEIYIYTDIDYTAILYKLKEGIVTEQGKHGVYLNGTLYDVNVLFDTAAPIRLGSGLWLNMKVNLYV